MNYSHSYHAGSFTDVLKHVVVTAILSSLSRKDSPFCYLDTHAGAGYYDLSSVPASKSKEYEKGILKVMRADNPQALIKNYLNCVKQLNQQVSPSIGVHSDDNLSYYPGSPLIAKYFARPSDRLILCEYHSPTYQVLKATFAGDKQVAIHHMDGFLALKAYLPPQEKRGLVLIDPPYEASNEFEQIISSLKPALKHFANGIYAIWYPIKDKAQLDRFYRSLQESIIQPMYVIELSIYPDLAQFLNGSGLIIVNPPWQLDAALEEILPWLWKVLSINRQGGYRSFMLK